jgi:peroxiredoxin
VLGVGDPIPDASVWTGPNRRASLRELVSEGRVLLLFYLFDWSST